MSLFGDNINIAWIEVRIASPWYDCSMTTRTEKIAISLPGEKLALVRKAVAEGRATSVSAFIVTAIEKAQASSELDALVAELMSEHGIPSEADYKWADEALSESQ
jgi:antitoxin ParD1/3/4